MGRVDHLSEVVARRGGHGDREDGGEAEVLAGGGASDGTVLSGAPGEGKGHDEDVVDVGDGEQACPLADHAEVHDRTIRDAGVTDWAASAPGPADRGGGRRAQPARRCVGRP